MLDTARRLVAIGALAVLLVVSASAQSASSPVSDLPSASVLDDEPVREEGKRGLDLLYDMRFEEAEAIFEDIDRRYPEHPIGPFMQALSTWWQILLDLEDTSHDETFYAAMEEVIDRSDRLLERDKESFDGAFFKALGLGFRGRLRGNRKKWFRAALDAKRAMDYALDLADRASHHPDFVFGKGLYDYFAAVIPERHPYVKPVMVFFPDGDRQRGLQELRRTADRGWFIQTEAAYFLTQINYFYEEDYTGSRRYVTWLRRQHPNNPYFHSLEGRIYARWGQWDRAQRIFEEVLSRHEQDRPGYNAALAEQALYYIARSHMTDGEYRKALTYLTHLEESAERTDTDTYYKVLGRLRQGMIYDVLDRREIAEQRYRSVLGMEDHGGAHDRARRYLDKPYGK